MVHFFLGRFHPPTDRHADGHNLCLIPYETTYFSGAQTDRIFLSALMKKHTLLKNVIISRHFRRLVVFDTLSKTPGFIFFQNHFFVGSLLFCWGRVHLTNK